MRANKITEAQENASSAISENSIAEIQSDFERLEFEYSRVQERLLNLDLMLDNHGWNELIGGSVAEEGPELDQLKNAAGQVRELTAVNSHMKQGNLLRGNYVWDGGIHYENISGAKGAGNKNIQPYIDNPQNQRVFFGPMARKIRAKARYTDGHNIYIGEDSTKLLTAISIERVTATLLNPEDSGEIWALRVERRINQNDAASKIEPTWIFLDEFMDKRQGKVIPYRKKNERVDMEHRIFMKRANQTIGWTWGTPDALAAMQWIRMYREFVIAGKKMSDAMAMIWAQAKGDNKQGAQNAAVQFSGNKQGSGGVAIGGPELATLATAGKGYDFSSGQAILAAAAAALEVSVIALSANPGAAGSSYGSAQTLDLPGRIAIAAIRAEEAEFDEQILRWMGARNAKAWFDTLLDADAIYRAVQAEMLYWATGLREPSEQKREMDKIKGKPISDSIPTGIMTPNNTKFPGTLSNDSVPQQASPDQGKSNGSGGAGNLGNQRKDSIGGDTGA